MRVQKAIITLCGITSCVTVMALDIEVSDVDAIAACLSPPIVKAAVAPDFPENAHASLEQGDIRVNTMIDEGGAVINAVVASSTRPTVGFEEAAVAAAKRWKFDVENACPVRRAELLFRFHKPVENDKPCGVEFRPPFQVDVKVGVIAYASCGIVRADTRDTFAEETGDSCDYPPIVSTAVAARFPELARVVRMHGDITVQAEIGESGVVKRAIVLSSTRPFVGFEEAAVAAAMRWTFRAEPSCASRRAELLFRFRQPASKSGPHGTEFLPPFRIDVVTKTVHIYACG